MEIINQTFEIEDKTTGEQLIFSPIAYENCMKPGEIKVVPVEYFENEECISIRIGSTEKSISKSKLNTGEIVITTHEFVPRLSEKRGCVPCRNCGQCGW